MNDTITTMVGTARYPHVNKPNTTFDPDGAYSCDIVVTEGEAKEFTSQMTAIRDQAHEMEEKKTGKKIRVCDAFPVKQTEDGQWIIRSKQKAKSKNSRTGEVYEFNIKLFDAQGKACDVEVGGGSKVKMAIKPYTWYSPSLGFGISLQLKALQIIELVAPSASGAGASSFGFTAEEEGFSSGGESLESVVGDGDF
jgi:hypothetical protein